MINKRVRDQKGCWDQKTGDQKAGDQMGWGQSGAGIKISKGAYIRYVVIKIVKDRESQGKALHST